MGPPKIKENEQDKQTRERERRITEYERNRAGQMDAARMTRDVSGVYGQQPSMFRMR